MSTAAAFDRIFADVLEDVLGWGTTYADSDGPNTVEAWDSLSQIRIVNALETAFDVRLPDSALLEQQTVGSLKQLVAEHGGRA
jgi:acyl carrier protein